MRWRQSGGKWVKDYPEGKPEFSGMVFKSLKKPGQWYWKLTKQGKALTYGYAESSEKARRAADAEAQTYPESIEEETCVPWGSRIALNKMLLVILLIPAMIFVGKTCYQAYHIRLGSMLPECRQLWDTKDYVEAFRCYEPLAKWNCAEAQRMLGIMYFYGNGVLKNETKSFHWFQKAAEHGDDIAQVRLGTMYLYGRGVAADRAKGLYWLKKSAEQDNIGALFLLYGELSK